VRIGSRPGSGAWPGMRLAAWGRPGGKAGGVRVILAGGESGTRPDAEVREKDGPDAGEAMRREGREAGWP
jgi:hypothetical protein